MGTYHDANPGDTFETPTVHVTDELAATLVNAGGYTHPLFTDPAFAAASPFGRTPVPGQAVLLLMGGLIEQSERFDDTVIALVGFDEVRFRAPLFAGDQMRVHAEVLHKESKGARGTVTYRWTARDADGEDLAIATARMLFRLGGPDPPEE